MPWKKIKTEVPAELPELPQLVQKPNVDELKRQIRELEKTDSIVKKEQIEKAVAIYVPYADKENLKSMGIQYNIFVSFDYNCQVFKQKTWFYIANPDNVGIKEILKKYPRNNNIRKNTTYETYKNF